MSGRILLATRMGLADQLRRPLLLVCLAVAPPVLISRSFAVTTGAPRTVILADGTRIATTMRDLHGATMAPIAIAFLAGLCGLFVIQSARQGDRRLALAGYRPAEVIAPRLAVLLGAVLLVLAVSMTFTGVSLTPESWPAFLAGNLTAGVTYGAIGALAGVAMGRLGGAYFMLFLPMLDIGVVQNPMFGDGSVAGWAAFLPGYGPSQVLLDGALGGGFSSWSALAPGLGWSVALVVAVVVVLRRSLPTPP